MRFAPSPRFFSKLTPVLRKLPVTLRSLFFSLLRLSERLALMRERDKAEKYARNCGKRIRLSRCIVSVGCIHERNDS